MTAHNLVKLLLKMKVWYKVQFFLFKSTFTKCEGVPYLYEVSKKFNYTYKMNLHTVH